MLVARRKAPQWALKAESRKRIIGADLCCKTPLRGLGHFTLGKEKPG
jgi:hypothetical protein